MKVMQGAARKRTLRVCMLTATVLFGAVFAQADVVLDWNVIAVNTAIANGQNPFAQARFAAIAQLAVFEAVNAITGDYRPYLGSDRRAARCIGRRSSHPGCLSGAKHLFSSQRINARRRASQLARISSRRSS